MVSCLAILYTMSMVDTAGVAV